MRNTNITNPLFVWAVFLTIILVLPTGVFAHCDTMNGPVVTAARKALDTADVNLVLIWVEKKDQAEIREAFQKTLAVRKLSPEAKELADMYFFETLVRIHRASEGEPYTGIKPAGFELGPAIPAVDKAIETGSVKPVLTLLDNIVHQGIHERFKEVLEKKNYNKDDIKAGRKYVKAYVAFLHYIEPVYEAAKGQTPAHHNKSEKTETPAKEHHH